jgi:hypothetical protein
VADPDEDDDPELPLEGANCAVHGDRPAFRVCPTCNANACLACWHPSIVRCHACLVRDAKSFPQLPWEDRTRTIFGRYFFTFFTALSPDSSAPRFAREADTSAAVFAVLSIVPLGLLSGIIPYTRTLAFGPLGDVQLIGHPDTNAIALDVLVAAFTGLAVSVIAWLAIALPYVSLSRAYADRGMPSAPIRVMNQRGWLVPFSFFLWHAVPFILPPPTSQLAFDLMHLPAALPPILLISAMRAVARMGSGAGPIATLGVVFVPVALFMLAVLFVQPLEVTSEELGLVPPTTTTAPAAP